MVVGGGLGAERERESRGATLGVHTVVAQCERKWEDRNEERRKLLKRVSFDVLGCLIAN